MNLVRAYNRSACVLTLLAISSYVIATVYVFQPALVIGLAGLPAVAAAWWYSSARGAVLPRWMVNGLLLLAVAYAAARASRGVSVEVIAELVVFIQLIKLGDRRSPRDDAQVLALAVFLAIAAMLTSNQLWVGVQLVAFVPLLIATVMLYQLYSAWFSTGRPAAPPVMQSRAAFRRIVAGATIATLGLSLFVFIIVPRGIGENVLGNWSVRQGAARVAFTDHVKLGSASIISSSPAIVLDMLVRDASNIDEEPGANMGGPDEVYYLRGAVLDDYDPASGLWRPKKRESDVSDSRVMPDRIISVPTSGAVRANARQDITIYGVAASDAPLFALWRPVRVERDRSASRIERDPEALTFRRFGVPGTVDYTVWSGQYEAAPPELPQRTPASFDSAPIHDLAARILRDAGVEPDPATRPVDDDSRAARAIQDYLQRNYTYTLVEQAPPAGADPIEHFLLTTREGHCEYFAAAMTLMCRSVGVNARMVAGYLAAEFNPSTGRYVVRESNAHAWVEAESTGIWRRFDPTPPADLARLHKPQDGLLASLRRAMESVEYAWNSGVVGFDEGTRQRIFGPHDGRRLGVFGFIDSLSGRLQSAGLRALFGALATGIAVFIVVAGAGLGLNWSIERLAPLIAARARSRIPMLARLSPERRHQLRFYARLLDYLRARGTPKPLWRPPLAHAQALARAGDDASGVVTRLSDLYYAATFGDRPLSVGELEEAERLLSEPGPGRP